jgi:hypothetical protein
MPVLASPTAIVHSQLSGLPNMPFGAGVGPALEPGQMTISGIANIDRFSPQFMLIADGFSPPGSAVWNTGPLGSFLIEGVLGPPMPGNVVSLQAAVLGPSGLVLSAPAKLMSVPGDPIPETLLFRFLDFGYSAGNRHAVVADVNNDGHLDYVNSSGIWAGNGAFGFTYVMVDPGGVEAAVADLVGDSNVDLVVLDEVFLGLKIYPGNGTGNFLALPPIQLPILTRDSGDVAVVDFDMDGDLDIVAASGGTASPGVVCFQNHGGGVFFLYGATFYDDGYAVAAADFDGDNAIDIAIAGSSTLVPAGETRILWGNSNPPHSRAGSTAVTGTPEPGCRWLRAFDMDQDGDQDLVWAGLQHQGVLLNQGGGAFTFSGASVSPSPCCPDPQLDAADLDQDGDRDLLFVDRTYPTRPFMVVAANDGTGHFPEVWYLPLEGTPGPAGAPAHVIAADLDGDGDDDCLAGGYNATIIVNEN